MCLPDRVTGATRLQPAGISKYTLAKDIAPIAISDEENSDIGDFAVTSDILPKKGRGRKPVKKEESVEEDDDDVADTKVTNGDAGEEDEDDDEDDEDMDEDE